MLDKNKSMSFHIERSKNFSQIKTRNFQHNKMQSDKLKLLIQNRYNSNMNQQLESQRLPHSIMKHASQKKQTQTIGNIISFGANHIYSPVDSHDSSNQKNITFSDQSSPSSSITYNVYSSNSPITFMSDINTVDSSIGLVSNVPGQSAALSLFSNSLVASPSSTSASLNQKPKVRFNLDINYEKEREWNRVNKIIGDASKSQIEWTQEVEV